MITDLEVFDQPEVRYFPNPTLNEVVIQTSIDWIGGGIELRDGSGRLVMTQNVAQPLARLNLISLPAGVYVASLIKEERRYTFKVSEQ